MTPCRLLAATPGLRLRRAVQIVLIIVDGRCLLNDKRPQGTDARPVRKRCFDHSRNRTADLHPGYQCGESLLVCEASARTPPLLAFLPLALWPRVVLIRPASCSLRHASLGTINSTFRGKP